MQVRKMQINIQDAKAQLSRMVDAAMLGEEVIIAKAGKPIARLARLEQITKKRQPGRLAGRLQIKEDFATADAEIQKMFDDSRIFPDGDV